MNFRRSTSGDEPAGGKENALVRLYRAALGCFPEEYRREYAEELLYAVRMAVLDAEMQGRFSLLILTLRELRDLPLAIVRAHLHERSRSMKLQPGVHLPGGPIHGWQLGAVFLPFLAPLLYAVQFWAFRNDVSWLVPALGLPILGLLIAILVLGLVGNFPLWSLPALGMVLFFASFFLHIFAQIVFFTVMLPVSGEWGWPDGLSLAGSIRMMLGIQTIFLVVTTGVVARLLRIVPGFHARVRQEWTLLSFLLYGIAILPVIGNDEFHGVDGYIIASLLVLAVGAGLYLTVPKRWQRVLALVFPAVLSPAIMSLGLYQTFPAQPWANPADPSFRWWEGLQPVLFLAPLPILLLLAALAPRLPGSSRQEPASVPVMKAPG